MPLFPFFQHTSLLGGFYTTAMLWYHKKPYNLAEFEPGFSVPEADAMSTAPRRHPQGKCLYFSFLCWKLEGDKRVHFWGRLSLESRVIGWVYECSPTHFLSKLLLKLNRRTKWPKMWAIPVIFGINAQSKHSTNGIKLVQSGHTARVSVPGLPDFSCYSLPKWVKYHITLKCTKKP
jgi:hypothetical protein